MNVRFELMMASRYLRSKRSERFVSIITAFSLIGITLGVATLIIVMSVMNGFRSELIDKIVGVNGHLLVYLKKDNRKNDHVVNIAEKISQINGVYNVSKELNSQVMVSSSKGASGIMLRGIDPSDLIERPGIEENIVEGNLKSFLDGTIVLGSRLASYLGVSIGDDVTILSASGTTTPFGTIPSSRAFLVSAVFDVGMYEYDRGTAFVSREDASLLANSEKTASQIEVFLINERDSKSIATVIQTNILNKEKVYTWEEIHSQLFRALKVEKNVMFLILTLIIFVAVFNVISSLIMLVKDKEKGVAILRTIGTSKIQIMRIFCIVGSSIGFVGTFFGFILGVFISVNITSICNFIESLIGKELFTAEVYFFNNLPSEVDAVEVFYIVFVSLILSFLATLYPSWKASKLDPVEILRYE